jgi:hypothetical protein
MVSSTEPVEQAQPIAAQVVEERPVALQISLAVKVDPES